MKNHEERMESIMKKAQLYKKKRGQIISTVTLGVCVAIFAVAGVNLNYYQQKQNTTPITDVANNESEVTSIEGELLAFASKEELMNQLEEQVSEYQKKNNSRNIYYTDDVAIDMAVAEESIATNGVASKSASFDAESPQSASGAESHSETNVQTKGVDESDIIKTDGKRIYYMNSERKDVKVFEDVNGNIHLIKTIELADNKNDYCYGDSMFLDDKYLVVISHYSKSIEDTTKEMEEEQVEKNSMVVAKKMIYPYYRTKSFTAIHVYDIHTYDLVRKIETEGNLVSARKIGDSIYLVSNKYLYYYSFNRDDVMPYYKDTLVSEEYCEAPIESIRAFKDFKSNDTCNYMIVTSVNLADSNSKAHMDTYLGAGNEIYCSTKYLYVTKPNYQYRYRNSFIDDVVDVITNDSAIINEPTTSTNIHKFAIADGKATYVATGKVPGTLLNQFSMDEYQGYFRITTTDDKGNNLYVLDEKLNQVGCLENLAKGERIYSTRFMGDKAYVVTYKTVDPLFVIDLSTPTQPTVLGELKIPGYSSYLHPLGDHYLLGFGEDSVEKAYMNWDGKQDVVAYATGLKMAIFDVSDYSNPKELYSVKIGGRGSSSELLYNHKALLLDEAKKLFAFPVRVNKDGGYYEDGTPKYGDLDFEGALVYNMDVETGFTLKGKITHEAENRYSKYGNIERIIYIGDKFYTVSNGMIKSTDMNTMQEVSSLKF